MGSPHSFLLTAVTRSFLRLRTDRAAPSSVLSQRGRCAVTGRQRHTQQQVTEMKGDELFCPSRPIVSTSVECKTQGVGSETHSTASSETANITSHGLSTRSEFQILL